MLENISIFCRDYIVRALISSLEHTSQLSLVFLFSITVVDPITKAIGCQISIFELSNYLMAISTPFGKTPLRFIPSYVALTLPSFYISRSWSFLEDQFSEKKKITFDILFIILNNLLFFKIALANNLALFRLKVNWIIYIEERGI